MEKKSNLIWIFGDQHRAQALGCMGDENISTPNIDALAADGVVFDRAVAGCPLCCPYRGSLLSGRYPHRAVPGHQMRLPPELLTIAQPFRAAGYHTAWFGKWHLDGFQEKDGRAVFHTIPKNRRGGFDTWLGYENNNAQYDTWLHGHADAREVEHYRLEGYETDALTDLVLGHIEQRAQTGAPFFAALSAQPPHNPYVAPPEWMGRHAPGRVALRENVPPIAAVVERAQRELAGYYAMIENLDWNVGRIVSALRARGIYDDTHIIFFSDHGDMHGSHGQFLKTSPWEEAVRVPFIVGGGRRYEMKAGTRVDAPLNHVDVGPTSLGLCGIEVPDWMPGTDYSHHRLRKMPTGSEPDSAYLQLVVPTGHGDSIDRPWRGIVTRDGWKYVALEGQPWLLHNLNEDPYELANWAFNTRYRSERRRLHERLAQWVDETGDVFALPEL
jgi:arylsulfatase A-like enzyme